jgi:nucleotide-binding universal stress UspA family protein
MCRIVAMYSARGSIPDDSLAIILSMPEFYLYLVFVVVLLITALWRRETGLPVGEPCSTDLMTTGRSVADAPGGSLLRTIALASSESKAMLAIRHILVPFDWAELSNRAFQLAASMAREHDAQLVVLYAVPHAAVIYGPPPESYLDHLLKELCRIKPSDPKTRVQHLLVEGNPATAILRAAKEINCDLIVMGTHGRTGLNRLLMGSVAEEVVRKAPCHVLIVKDPVSAN